MIRKKHNIESSIYQLKQSKTFSRHPKEKQTHGSSNHLKVFFFQKKKCFHYGETEQRANLCQYVNKICDSCKREGYVARVCTSKKNHKQDTSKPSANVHLSDVNLTTDH